MMSSPDPDDFQRMRPIFHNGKRAGEVEYDDGAKLWQGKHWRGETRWFNEEYDAATWVKTFDRLNPPTRRGK